MKAKIESQTFGMVDLLEEGWRLYRANFTTILLVILCVYMPVNLIISFIPIDSLIQEFGTRWIQLYNDILRSLEFFIGTIATIGIAEIIEKSLQGTTLSWKDSLRHGLSKWMTAIGTGLLVGIIVLGFLLLLIVPGIIWYLYYSFWIYVVALRNISGTTALDYSKRLVQGQWWRVFGISLGLGIIASVISLAVTIPFYLISDNPFLAIIPNTISDIIGGFFTVVMVIFFLNNDYRIKSPVR